MNIHILRSKYFSEDRAVAVKVTTYRTTRWHNSDNYYPNFDHSVNISPLYSRVIWVSVGGAYVGWCIMSCGSISIYVCVSKFM